MSDVTFSPDQEKALDLVDHIVRYGGCLFLTGKAGTGKSTVSREIIRRYRTVKLAPTGLAAVNIGGETIHRFFGLKPGFSRKRPLGDEKKGVIEYSDLILIDEVSMMRADLVDQIDIMLRMTTKRERPFGGKPVVFVGDPWQLEPVVKPGKELDFIRTRYVSPFFFDSYAWEEANPLAIELETVFRQANPEFRDALNLIREGNPKGLDFVNQAPNRPSSPDSVIVSYTNKKADELNDYFLSRLDGDEVLFEAETKGEISKEDISAPMELKLKPHARVMAVANDSVAGYVNGDLGWVAEITDSAVRVAFDRGNLLWVERQTFEKMEHQASPDNEDELDSVAVAEATQIPLKLAWAVSVHKSQGQTFDSCHIAARGQSFCHGQTYVALSRCKSIDGLSISRKLAPEDLVVNRRVAQWVNNNLKRAA
jgi:plasmid maintenance system antidote protein VapI